MLIRLCRQQLGICSQMNCIICIHLSRIKTEITPCPNVIKVLCDLDSMVFKNRFLLIAVYCSCKTVDRCHDSLPHLLQFCLCVLQVWKFSSQFSSVDRWSFSDTPSMSNHLGTCSFYQREDRTEPVALPCLGEVRDKHGKLKHKR